MFERYTEPARRVVVLASEEARRLRHDHMGTEHFLLALIRDEQSAGSSLLSALAIAPAAVRRDLEQIVPAGEGSGEPAGHLPFTPGAKEALELALQEAVRLNSPHIGTEHLLLGLLREGQGPAAQVLTELGADLKRARRAVPAIAPDATRPA